MAIYHCSVKVGSRSNGASAVGSCAYRESVKIKDERLGIVHDYSRKSGVIESFTIAPKNAPTWASDPAKLWNKVEHIEKRKDAQVFREVVVALPRELDLEKQKRLVSDYVQRNFIDKGMCATVAIHETANKNPHAHIMLTTRTINQDGFGQKQRDWNQKNNLESWRSDWSQSVNKALQRDGLSCRVDHRSLERQGIARTPQIHMGKVATAMEREGIDTVRGDRNRTIIDSNQTIDSHIQTGIANARLMYEARKELDAQNKAKALTIQKQRERGEKLMADAEQRYRESKNKDEKQEQEPKIERGRGFSL